MTVQAGVRQVGGTSRVSPRLDRAALDRLAARLTRGPGEREPIAIVAPATGALVGEVPHATEEDLELAVSRARFAQQRWAARPARERAAVLLRFHDLVLDRRAEGMDLIQLEGGKARRDALEEIHETANAARYYGRASPRHLRPRFRRGALPVLTDAREYHHPVGVVGVIAPWNFPLILGITDALPALAAGCGVVTKLDSRTPFSALWAAKLLESAGLPPGLLALVTGSGEQLGPPLIDRVDYVMFTGSTRVGREVAARCAERLIGCSLELGGKNAMLVLDDADIERAAEGARKGSFSHAGQMCVGMERIYVHEDVYEPFARRLVELTEGMRVGSGLEHDYEMGSLLSQRQLETVEAHVADAVAKGASVLAGGRAAPGRGAVLLRADRPGGGDPRDDALRRGDLRPRRLALPRPLRRGGGRAGECEPLRPQLQRVDRRSAARPEARADARGGHRQRQRGLRRRLVLDGGADGRLQGLGARPPARRARDREVHGAADGRRCSASSPPGARAGSRRSTGTRSSPRACGSCAGCPGCAEATLDLPSPT